MAAQSASTIPARVKDLTGNRFGRLTVIQFAGIEKHKAMWSCRCDCGTAVVARSSDLGRYTRSCGCLLVESTGARFSRNGKKPLFSVKDQRREYVSYHGLINRCLNPRRESYPRYGGRGITVCDRWKYGEHGLSGFDCFFLDMGRRPDGDYSLDRIDNDGDYGPDNCRWADRITQANNKSPRAL